MEVERIGRFPVKRLMRPAGIVERQRDAEAVPGGGDRVVGLEVNLLVLDAFPESFDEDVIAPAAFAIHADLDPVVLEQVGEIAAGELAALIRVEDFRLAETSHCFTDRLEAEVSGEGVGKSPGQDLAAVPVDDGNQIDEAPRASGCK